MTKKLIGVALIFSLFIWTMNTLLVAHAASLTAMSDTMSNQTVSANSSHVIKFTTPTGVTGSGQSIVIIFPTGFNFTSKTISSLTLTYGASTGLETTATIAAGPGASTTWGAAFSTTNNLTLTLSSPTAGTYIAAGNKVILTYDSTNSVNPSSAANYSVSLTANGDTGTITVPIITNDQVAITATVSQALNFSLSANSINFGPLSTSATTYATTVTGQATEPSSAHTLVAGTNATSGYTISLSGSTLTSGSNTIAAIPGVSAAALAPGTAQFGIRTTAAGGTGATVTAPFNGTAGNYGFGTSPLSSQSFASVPGPSVSTTYSVNYAANIAALTPAGNYATTLTYVATSNF